MTTLLRVLLVCHVALASARLVILPNDADEEWCTRAGCSDNEMCVLDSDKNEVKCMDQSELTHFVKNHGSQHSDHRAHVPEQKKDKPAHSSLHCSRNELMRMGGRLAKWFKDVHSVVAGVEHTLKLHSVPCRPDVAWMFGQWDGNSDGLLSKSELRPIERGGNEPCVEEFIDICDDMVVDGSISVDEWCDCFSFSDDLRHEPPCHKAKHEVDPHLLGVFLPRCDLEGFYKPEQCHEGHCWCVDRYGREFDKSRVSNSLPDCGQYASDLTEEDVVFLKARM
ncbi:unnamed protein product [Caenorhabditis sp. 36 PRJEB53466]|nr:unnamed protein product [Caenorhabditis sp. 36 PRJEB53466]